MRELKAVGASDMIGRCSGLGRGFHNTFLCWLMYAHPASLPKLIDEVLRLGGVELLQARDQRVRLERFWQKTERAIFKSAVN